MPPNKVEEVLLGMGKSIGDRGDMYRKNKIKPINLYNWYGSIIIVILKKNPHPS
jgi:hypothetical protein